ncbi:MAG: hypothetical protein KDA84_08255 [Planctomycetaceae bacterium]|nr:hypothetical protein [Planctomycetaceae bacterium]
MVHRLFSPLPLVALTLALVGTLTTTDQAIGQVVYIEEDWEIQIGTPDPDGEAPQIITAMSSTDRLEDVHAILEMNHSTLPDYQAGGMSLQIWSSGTNLDYMVHPHKDKLHIDNEVLTYKMTMKISDGTIRFEVKNGTASSWGNYGIGGFHRTVTTPQTEFTQYSPATSAKFSKVGYAKHRVKKFFLKESRTYNAAGELISRDTTERVVHELTPDSE